MKTKIEDKAKDHKNISFTADHHTYYREFYGPPSPWIKDISEFTNGKKAHDAFRGKKSTQLGIVPIFEARYKGTTAAITNCIEKDGIRQVLSLGAGMEERCIAIVSTHPQVTYVETDISDVFKKKSSLVDGIFSKYGLRGRNRLFFEVADLKEKRQLEKALTHFKREEPLILVNEGVMNYYSEEENAVIAGNIHTILEQCGGVWITSDPSLNHASRKILLSHIQNTQKDLEKKIAERTGRSYDQHGFKDEKAAEDFFNRSGFTVRKYGQASLGYTLNSIDKVGLEPTVQKQLSKNIKKLMKVWVMGLGN